MIAPMSCAIDISIMRLCSLMCDGFISARFLTLGVCPNNYNAPNKT